MAGMSTSRSKECPICGKRFTPKDADTGSYQARYCSYACNNKSRTIHVAQPCVSCGKVFKPRRAGHKACSYACGAAVRRQNRVLDPMVAMRGRLARFCCSCIARCLRNKTDRTAVLLVYTVEQLRAHLEAQFEPGMSWSNYGKGKGQWSIDHIRPILTFPSEASIQEINALNNLRPLWHSENCAKRHHDV